MKHSRPCVSFELCVFTGLCVHLWVGMGASGGGSEDGVSLRLQTLVIFLPMYWSEVFVDGDTTLMKMVNNLLIYQGLVDNVF